MTIYVQEGKSQIKQILKDFKGKTESELKAFCNEHDLKLSVSYSDSYIAGTELGKEFWIAEWGAHGILYEDL